MLGDSIMNWRLLMNNEQNGDFKGGLWKSTAKSDEDYWCSRKIIH